MLVPFFWMYRQIVRIERSQASVRFLSCSIVFDTREKRSNGRRALRTNIKQKMYGHFVS